MTTQPGIIRCSGVVFITCPIASWRSVTDLLMPMTDRRKLGVKLGLWLDEGKQYYMVTVGDDLNLPERNPLPWDEKVRRVVQYAWDQLTEWGDVTGPMPEIIQGDPTDMLP